MVSRVACIDLEFCSVPYMGTITVHPVSMAIVSEEDSLYLEFSNITVDRACKLYRKANPDSPKWFSKHVAPYLRQDMSKVVSLSEARNLIREFISRNDIKNIAADVPAFDIVGVAAIFGGFQHMPEPFKYGVIDLSDRKTYPRVKSFEHHYALSDAEAGLQVYLDSISEDSF